MNNPKISIITVVKNGVPYLSDCLKSFQLQDYPNKEHIIIYSNSNDGTEEFLLSKKKKIKILKKDKKFNNKWDCLNLGAKLATGDIIGILNSDDYYYPQELKIIKNEKNVGELTGYFYSDFETGKKVWKYQIEKKERLTIDTKMNVIPVRTSTDNFVFDFDIEKKLPIF